MYIHMYVLHFNCSFCFLFAKRNSQKRNVKKFLVLSPSLYEKPAVLERARRCERKLFVELRGVFKGAFKCRLNFKFDRLIIACLYLNIIIFALGDHRENLLCRQNLTKMATPHHFIKVPSLVAMH